MYAAVCRLQEQSVRNEIIASSNIVIKEKKKKKEREGEREERKRLYCALSYLKIILLK